ncbi:AAA domain-containing protein, partial [Ochromonadaceae sp. CCMP2298]
LEKDVVAEASLVFSTVNVSGKKVLDAACFDVAVVDEATMMVQAETALVLRSSLQCLVLAGDDKQLPAMVTSMQCKHLGFGESLFSRLLRLQYPYSLLETQYRMHPHISAWPRGQFYEGRVVDG